MNKPILIIVLVAIVGISAYTLLHKQFNKTVEVSPVAPSDARFVQNIDEFSIEDLDLGAYISYKDVASELKTMSGKQLLFVGNDSSDTSYIEGSILFPLLNEFETPLNLDIIYVDMSGSEDVSVVNLQKVLNIEVTPSFVLVDANEKKKSYEVVSKLSFVSDEPFTVDELRTWFFDNGIWTGPYGKN